MSNPLLDDALIEVVGRDEIHTNLDHADAAPASLRAATAAFDALALDSSPVETARLRAGAFVGARADDSVIFSHNATEAVNLLAQAVRGDAIVLDIEHHSNLLPWLGKGARILPVGRSIDELLALLAYELRSRSAAIVAVSGASHVTGERLPLRSIAALVHRHGARLAVDGVQLVPHRRVDISGDDIDYLVYSARTLSAGTGVGVLVGRSDWLDAARPRSLGAGAALHVGHDRIDWATGPARHEAGSANVSGVLALVAAIDQFDELGLDRIARHGESLRSALVAGLRAIDGVTLLRLFSDSADPVPIVGFTLDGVDSRRAAQQLRSRRAIRVGDGLDSAHLLRERLGGSSIRASIGLGSSVDDVDNLLDAIAELT
jgi:selenocysteine lyase/cysteine desulfurase